MKPASFKRLPAAALTAVLTVALGAVIWRVWQAPRAPAATEYQASAGERRTVRLADDSRVELAATSGLRVPHDFNMPERSIELEGEAFFEVVADSARLFIARTRTAEVRGAGAAFVMSEYAGQRAAEVIVVSGRVEFGSRRVGRLTAVSAGEVARVSEDGALVVRVDAEAGAEALRRYQRR